MDSSLLSALITTVFLFAACKDSPSAPPLDAASRMDKTYTPDTPFLVDSMIAPDGKALPDGRTPDLARDGRLVAVGITPPAGIGGVGRPVWVIVF